MRAYKDRGGNRFITAYETGPDYISIRFMDGTQYRYTWKSAGALNVERMKWLAVTGDNLKDYMDRYRVGNRYAQIEA